MVIAKKKKKKMRNSWVHEYNLVIIEKTSESTSKNGQPFTQEGLP